VPPAGNLDLRVLSLANRYYFPPTTLGGADMVSGYVVPAWPRVPRVAFASPPGQAAGSAVKRSKAYGRITTTTRESGVKLRGIGAQRPMIR
jgi:hypothetical protein